MESKVQKVVLTVAKKTSTTMEVKSGVEASMNEKRYEGLCRASDLRASKTIESRRKIA
jgi:hypothetical protein